MLADSPTQREKSPFRSGFVCLAGAPNVGKSTLLNRLVGQAISITAPKPQTTRTRILGILHGEDFQAVFVDTPGIHRAGDPLNVRMVGYALAALRDADLRVLMVEPHGAAGPPPDVRASLESMAESASPAVLVINKIDRAGERKILETIAWHDRQGGFEEIFPLSALKGRGVDRLQGRIPAYLSEGPPYFEPDQVTDQPEEQIVSELVRQEIFRRTHQEVPYSTAVRVEGMEESDGLLTIHADILVEWDSQKGILIGKQGRKLKAIGQAARRNIEALFGSRVYLALRVVVLKDWSRDPRRLEELGYPKG